MSYNEPMTSPLALKRTVSTFTLLMIGGVLLCLFSVIGGALFYYDGPCGVNRVKAAALLLNGQLQEYDDAYKVAASASRVSLAEPIAELRRIRQETEKIEVPGCMEQAKSELILSFESAVAAFLSFSAQEPDTTVTSMMEESVLHLSNFSTELEEINECAPFCQAVSNEIETP